MRADMGVPEAAFRAQVARRGSRSAEPDPSEANRGTPDRTQGPSSSSHAHGPRSRPSLVFVNQP